MPFAVNALTTLVQKTAPPVGGEASIMLPDLSSVAMNQIIKFTTLFGLLAVELARGTNAALAVLFLAIALVFVWRSFYRMRIDVTHAVRERDAVPVTGGV